MVTIGDKKLVFSTSFLAADNQEVLVTAPLEGTAATIQLSVTFVPELTPTADGSWQTIGDVVKFTFTGWTNTLGTAVTTPTKFGDLGDKKLFFQMAHSLLGELNFVHLFIFIGN